MKLSTHNLLMCNKKTCIDNEKNYPLIIKAVKVNTVKSEFDEEKTKVFFDKMDKRALNQGCKDLNISKFDLEKMTEEQLQDKDVLEYLHNILFEVGGNGSAYEDCAKITIKKKSSVNGSVKEQGYVMSFRYNSSGNWTILIPK